MTTRGRPLCQGAPQWLLPSLVWVLGLTSAQGEETPVLFLSELSTMIRNIFKWITTISVYLAFKAHQLLCKMLSEFSFRTTLTG